MRFISVIVAGAFLLGTLVPLSAAPVSSTPGASAANVTLIQDKKKDETITEKVKRTWKRWTTPSHTFCARCLLPPKRSPARRRPRSARRHGRIASSAIRFAPSPTTCAAAAKHKDDNKRPGNRALFHALPPVAGIGAALHIGRMAKSIIERWPELPYKAWKDTLETLHLFTQVIGKIRLAQTPWMNHSWHVTLYVTARGLTTSPIAVGRRHLPDRLRFHRSRPANPHQ